MGTLRTWLRDLLGLMPTLDLHGLHVAEALDATARFLERAAQGGAPRVRIVYGKGRHSAGGVGVLRTVIPAWLEQHGGERVVRFERQLDAAGEDASLVVWLRGASPSPPREAPAVVEPR